MHVCILSLTDNTRRGCVPNCGGHITIISRYCRFCGVPVPAGSTRTGDLICSYCAYHNRSDALYCIQCGDRLLR